MIVNNGNYYGGLDTVRFGTKIGAKQRQQRAYGTVGVALMGTLTTGFPIVLSQSQSFDCLPLLTALESGDKSTVGLTRLVRNGHLQVRLFGPALKDPPRSDIPKFSVMNALCSALARSDFVFSAWPELEGDSQRRQWLLECLTHTPDRIASSFDQRTASRINGLRELDSSLAQSPAPTQALGAASKTLRDYVLGHLEELKQRGGEIYEAVSLKLIECGKDPSQQLNNRSEWLKLLETLRADYGSYMHPALDASEDMVHAAYNRVMSESVIASGREISTGFKVVVDALEEYDDTSSAVPRVVAMATDKKRESWLTWDRASELMEQMSDMTLPPRRADFLASDRCELLLDRTADFVGVCVAVPTTAVMAAAGGPDLADGAWAWADNAVWGAGAGLVSWAASKPAAKKVGKRMIGSRLGARAKRLSEASVSDGTAKWEDLITRVTGERID